MAKITHEVTIYGASDDLIEVEGDYSDEFPCDGAGTVLIVGPYGEAVTVRCELDTYWSVQPRVVRGAGVSLEVHPRPDGFDGDMAVTARFPLAETSKSAILVYLVERS